MSLPLRSTSASALATTSGRDDSIDQVATTAKRPASSGTADLLHRGNDDLTIDSKDRSTHAASSPAMAEGLDLGPGWSSRTPTRPTQPLTYANDQQQGQQQQQGPAGSSMATMRVPLTSASGQQNYNMAHAGPSTHTDAYRQNGPQSPLRSSNGSIHQHNSNSMHRHGESSRMAQRAQPTVLNEKLEAGASTETMNSSRRQSTVARSEDGDAGNNDGSVTRGAPPSVSSANNDKDAQSRKQNSACDACRNRKVRCNRAPGEDKCAHCKSKGIECTTIYVQLATSGVKRPAKRPRADGQDSATDPAIHVSEESFQVVKYLLLRDADYSNQMQGFSFPELSRKRGPTTAAESRLNNATARQEFVSSLLETYFSTVHIRYPIIDPHEFLQRFHYQSPELGGPPTDPLVAVLLAWGAKFSSHPIILADRREAAHEELSPSQRQKRHAAHGVGANPEHTRPVSRASSEASSDFVRSIGRSRIAEELIVKAQEVLDRCKVHRIATMDNVKAALIIEALFWQQASETEEDNATLPAQLRARQRRGVFICNGTWVNSALTHMLDMKVHLQETVLRIEDESQRGQIAMTWWLGCMMDAHMSAFYRRKPMLSSEDYSTEPPSPPSSAPAGQAGPQPTAAESGFRIWLDSALEQVEMMRSVYFALFTPRAAREGISARKLENLASMAYRWRSNHLKNVGAPDPDWPVHWKFVDAVTACSSDINYQVVWILMWQAIDEFDIAELKATNISAYNLACLRHGSRTGLSSTVAEMELDQSKIRGLRTAIYDEALKAALRSAHLAGMLCDFDYLQHEAGIMKYSLCEAGYCLTRFRRPEVSKIIRGLRQYGQAFEECYEQANELERLASEYMYDSGSGLGLVESYGGGVSSPALQRPQAHAVNQDRHAHDGSQPAQGTFSAMSKQMSMSGMPGNAWDAMSQSGGANAQGSDNRQMAVTNSGAAPQFRRNPQQGNAQMNGQYAHDNAGNSFDFGANRGMASQAPAQMPHSTMNVPYLDGQGQAPGMAMRQGQMSAQGNAQMPPQAQMGMHAPQSQQQQAYASQGQQHIYSSAEMPSGLPDASSMGYVHQSGMQSMGPQAAPQNSAAAYRGQGLGASTGAQSAGHNAPLFY